MSEYIVGSVVREIGACVCTVEPVLPPGSDRKKRRPRDFRDVQDCFHLPSTVGRNFTDGTVWVLNRHGFGRRFGSRSLVKLNTPDVKLNGKGVGLLGDPDLFHGGVNSS